MPKIIYVEHDGSKHEIEVEIGNSVMQGAVDNMIEGIVGDCGGTCSCATCHCYVDKVWLDKIGMGHDMEHEMLDCAVDPQPNSRLSCQIKVTEELDGLIVYLPESQY